MLCERAEYNFLYVCELLRAVSRGEYDEADGVTGLPFGISGLFQRFFERSFGASANNTMQAASTLQSIDTFVRSLPLDSIEERQLYTRMFRQQDVPLLDLARYEGLPFELERWRLPMTSHAAGSGATVDGGVHDTNEGRPIPLRRRVQICNALRTAATALTAQAQQKLVCFSLLLVCLSLSLTIN